MFVGYVFVEEYYVGFEEVVILCVGRYLEGVECYVF